MTVTANISISPEKAKAAIDKALEKVATQLRELNNYV
jgi:hypothetical protein